MNGGPAAANGSIRVVLADDDQDYLESLRALIDGQPELTVVGTAADGLALVELVDRVHPDAAVIDLHMPRLDGASAIGCIRRQRPSICLIALTGDDDTQLHEAVTRAGADGVLLKSELVERLVERLSALRAA